MPVTSFWKVHGQSAGARRETGGCRGSGAAGGVPVIVGPEPNDAAPPQHRFVTGDCPVDREKFPCFTLSDLTVELVDEVLDRYVCWLGQVVGGGHAAIPLFSHLFSRSLGQGFLSILCCSRDHTQCTHSEATQHHRPGMHPRNHPPLAYHAPGIPARGTPGRAGCCYATVTPKSDPTANVNASVRLPPQQPG